MTSAELLAVLRAVHREQALDRPGTSLQLVAPTGRLVAADAVGLDVDVDGPTPDCGWPVGTDPEQLTSSLPDPGVGQQLLRLGFVSGVGRRPAPGRRSPTSRLPSTRPAWARCTS